MQLSERMENKPRLVGILADDVAHVWLTILPLMELACARSGGRYVASDLLEFFIERKMQLWLVMEGHVIVAAVVTEIINYPQLKECVIAACVGHGMRRWVHLLSIIEEWAMDNGCRKIRPIARAGWERVLARFGYVKTHVYLEKDLGSVH